MKKKALVKSKGTFELEERMRNEPNFFYIEKDMTHPIGWPNEEGNAQITLLLSDSGMTIEVYDKPSGLPVFNIKIDAEKTLQVLSRYARTYCDMETYNLDKIGKKQRIATLYVNLGKNVSWRNKELAIEKILERCPKPWVSDMYLDSQDSFMKDEKDNMWCKTVIRRYE
jgi:hypothetical protein